MHFKFMVLVRNLEALRSQKVDRETRAWSLPPPPILPYKLKKNIKKYNEKITLKGDGG